MSEEGVVEVAKKVAEFVRSMLEAAGEEAKKVGMKVTVEYGGRACKIDVESGEVKCEEVGKEGEPE